jgi:hypothetical protein
MKSYTLRKIAGIWLVLIFSFGMNSMSFGQSVGASSFGIDVGPTIPLEDGFGVGLGIKSYIQYSLGFISPGFFVMLDRPSLEEFSEVKFQISGFGLDFEIPFASEASMSPFIKIGAGMYKASASDSFITLESDHEFGLNAIFGIRFSPEQWSGLSIIISGEYTYIDFNSSYDKINAFIGLRYTL